MRTIPRTRVVVTVLVVAMTVSACSSPTPGLLTQSDLPSSLGVKPDPHAFQPGEIRTLPCKQGLGVGVIFDGSWRHLKPGPYSIPTVTSIAVSCASVSLARRFFNTRKIGARGYPIHSVKGHSVAGIGAEAWFVDSGRGTDLRDYFVVWRQDDRVSIVGIEGPVSDKRITPSLVEQLARRVVARS